MDRICNDMLYSASMCMVVFAHVNYFKRTLPHTRSLEAFTNFVHTQPELRVIAEEQGIKYAVAEYVRQEMLHASSTSGSGTYPEGPLPSSLPLASSSSSKTSAALCKTGLLATAYLMLFGDRP
ncbi:hypothetical protein JCM3770_006325 [Rhodotorula araucariae]